MSDEDRPDSREDTGRSEAEVREDRDRSAERPDGAEGDAPGAEAAGDAETPGEGDDGDPTEQLSEEIREELAELEELRDRHLRLAAEFENYRKRTRREKREARERAQASLAEQLLDALDDLERFLETPADETTAEALREGVEMVRDKLWKELSEAGLERMEPRGEPFDPERHDALITRPVEDPEDGGRVSGVLMNGYLFGDRVLRPARVEVTRHEEREGGEGAGDEAGADGADEVEDESSDGDD